MTAIVDMLTSGQSLGHAALRHAALGHAALRQAALRRAALRRSAHMHWARGGIAAALLACASVGAVAQGIQPGEAVVTRFSGTTAAAGPAGQQVSTIDPAGAVASIIDLRAPRRPPTGDHWYTEPQRNPITAGQVGQVFGVAISSEMTPSIFLTATSAFGLHRTPDNSNWMPGMWGPAGPGGIYKLDAQSGYQPRPFANITLNGRPNNGAALGNIAYDRWNNQLFVSDLETGMIHRIRAGDGADLGYYDHGVQGRANFLDAEAKSQRNMAPVAFDPASRPRIADCAAGVFQNSPQCWNLAANGRRVWGLAVGRASGGDLRLYYSVASSPEFGDAAWKSLPEDEKRNSVWSVRLGPDGGFDVSSVRREFTLPDFFVNPQDIARAGLSRPVSDISFPQCTDKPIMLLGERGGMRNLGVDAENAFATPHESRALRYELHQDGVWRPVGRYDVGSYYRFAEGVPYLFANCAGGVTFGYGYTPDWAADARQVDQYVWITGDSLCSPNGLCRPPAGAEQGQDDGDPSEVHGIQGMTESSFAELAPASAFAEIKQSTGYETQSVGIDRSYLIDTDINADQSGTFIYDELVRNDATRIGDIAIFAPCEAPPVGFVPVMAPPPVIIYEEGHAPSISHGRFASHRVEYSHYRYGSHWPVMSHLRWGSHWPAGSVGHWPPGSIKHWPPGSIKHFPPGSIKHFPPGSIKHFPPGSLKHLPPGSIKHFPPGSIKHFPPGSVKHFPPGSIKHLPPGSIKHFPPGSVKHLPPGSIKHFPPGSVKHLPPGSIKHFPPGSVKLHQPPGSGGGHFPPGSVKLHQPPGSIKLHQPPGSIKLHQPPGSIKLHQPPGSAGPQHMPPGSVKLHQPPGSVKLHQPPGSVKLHQPPGSVKQHFPPGSVKLHSPPGSVKQHFPPGSAKKHAPPGSAKLPPGGGPKM